MQPVRPPSSVVFWTAGALALAGLIGAALWGFFTYQGLEDRLAALPRTTVPGQVTVEVSEPEGLTVYYEDPFAAGTFVVQTSGSNTLDTSPVDLTVTGPSGEQAVTAPYQRDLRFDHDGRIVTALATIDTPTAGTYTVQVSGNVPPAARVSVGHVVDFGLLANAAGVIILFIGTLVAALVTVLVAALKRNRARSGDVLDRQLTRA